MIRRLKSFLFENKTTNQTIAKNTFWMFFGSILSRIIKALLLIYAARVMEIKEWGAFSYVFSLAALFTIFMDFGVNSIINRESSRDISVQEKYFSTAIIFKIFLFLSIGLCVYFIAPFFIKQGEILFLIPLIVLMFGFDSLKDFGASLSRAWDKMEIESFVQIFTNLMILVSGFFALYIAKTANSLTIGYLIGTGVGMIFAFFPFAKYFKNIKANFDFSLLKKIILSAWPFGMLGVMGAIMLNTDTIMIGWYKSIDDVGYYGAAQRIIQMVYLLPSVFAIAFFPSMSRAVNDKGMMKKLLENGVSLLTLFAIPITVGGVFLAGDMIKILYGSSFGPAVDSFRLLCLSFLPVFIASMFGNAIFALNKERKLIIYVLIGIFGNFIFNLILIPIFGIEGAAISTVINQIILTFYLIYFLKKELDFKVLHQIGKITLAAVVMGGVLFVLKLFNLNLYLNVFVGIAVYFSILWLCGERSVVFIWSKIKSFNSKIDLPSMF